MQLDLSVRDASGARLRSETLLERSGAHVIVITSVLADLALTLCSSYLSDLSDRCAVSHLRCTRTGNAFAQRVVENLGGVTLARGCLLDHAAELRATTQAAAGREIRVEIPDAALAQAADVWS
jgi:hypothetical protein